MKSFLLKLTPWIITVIALYLAFHGVEFSALIGHISNADPALLGLAVCLTLCSYLLRARRWQSLFSKPCINYFQAAQVLFLGFFMNNILPARAGEFVRAHTGSKITGERRTLVLATIVNERLADGLTLSLFFVIFSLHAGDETLSHELLIVAYLFGAIGMSILMVLMMRRWIYGLLEIVHQRLNNRLTAYLTTRISIFIDGLAPLFSPRRLPVVVVYSLAIWAVELAVYVSITSAYKVDLGSSGYVLFLVAVNFSSLIPAAPGGVGVVEAVATAALVSIGVLKSQALAMALTQHLIQYLVVGIPGALALLTWKGAIKDASTASEETQPNVRHPRAATDR